LEVGGALGCRFQLHSKSVPCVRLHKSRVQNSCTDDGYGFCCVGGNRKCIGVRMSEQEGGNACSIGYAWTPRRLCTSEDPLSEVLAWSDRNPRDPESRGVGLLNPTESPFLPASLQIFQPSKFNSFGKGVDVVIPSMECGRRQ
jgi:hypothetical protein